jgi:hypothetical protein
MSAIAGVSAPPRRIGRSIAAIVVGFFVTAALSLVTDQILHVLNVYPPWGQPMWDPGLNALALAYRIVYTIFGCWLTARLAPRRPMLHAMILGTIGFVIASAGAIVAITQFELGPAWYPIALALTTLPCAWFGGRLVLSPRRA